MVLIEQGILLRNLFFSLSLVLLCAGERAQACEDSRHESEKSICDWVMKDPKTSEYCANVGKDKILTCLGGEPGLLDVIGHRGIGSGVAKGASNAAKDIASTAVSGAAWAWSYLGNQAADYWQKLVENPYLQQNTEKSHPQPRKLNPDSFTLNISSETLKIFAGTASAEELTEAFQASLDYLPSFIPEFSCMHHHAQTEAISTFLTELTFPPAALFQFIKGAKLGLKGHELLKSMGQYSSQLEQGVSSAKRWVLSKTHPVTMRVTPQPIESIARKANEVTPNDVSPYLTRKYGLLPSQLSYSRVRPLKGRKLRPEEESLTNIKVRLTKKLGGGVNSTSIVTLEDGTKAVWKPHVEWGPSNYRAEVLAYELDQKFGFNLVPPTVERTINGRKGSLQLFIENTQIAADSKITPLQGDLHKQRIFDFIIGNFDRHGGNYLIKPDGHIVSIDHGISFYPTGVPGIEKPSLIEFFSSREGQEILERIRNGNTDAFVEEMENYLGRRGAKGVRSRIDHLMLKYDAWRSDPNSL